MTPIRNKIDLPEPQLCIVALALASLLACSGDGSTGSDTSRESEPIAMSQGQDLTVPPAGELYHGVFPGGFDVEEDGITPATLTSYETAVGRKVAWVYFSHNWHNGRAFPAATAGWIKDRGALPFIRLMLRSSEEQYVQEPTFTLDRIIAGEFDSDLIAWGIAAAQFGSPLVVEWGTEANGAWFSWNGVWNGGDAGGPALFRNAFQHIVQVISDAGGTNISWAFHVDCEDNPEEDWNRLENYYPGDDVVDWIGVSIYGAGSPLQTEWTDFRAALDDVVDRFTILAPGKPLFVFEFGASGGTTVGNAANWADDALTDLLSGRWPPVRGFSWWNEGWRNDSNPEHDTDMRVETVPGLAAVFRAHLSANAVVDTPVMTLRANDE